MKVLVRPPSRPLLVSLPSLERTEASAWGLVNYNCLARTGLPCRQERGSVVPIYGYMTMYYTHIWSYVLVWPGRGCHVGRRGVRVRSAFLNDGCGVLNTQANPPVWHYNYIVSELDAMYLH